MFNLEYEKTIRLPRRCMRFVGIWPEISENIYSKLRVFVSLFILAFFIIIPQTTQLFYLEKNLYNVLEILLIGQLHTTVCFL